MPKAPTKDAAPDDKSKAAGEQKPADKAGESKDNPSNGQSIEQIAGSNNSKQGDSKVRRTRAEIEKDELLDDLKSENREMKKMIRDEVIPTIRELQAQVKKGGTNASDAEDELDALAKEWELEPKFVKRLSTILLSKSKKQFEDEYLSEFKDIKSKTEAQSKEINNAHISAAISKEFDRAIAENPEMGKVAKKEAVRKYILSNEENLKRTMEDILEELYGDVTKNDSGIEGYSSQGGNHPKEPDYKSPTEEDHKRIAESRVRGGKEFEQYQDSLIDRLTHRSRHRNK
jgi:ribosomal protein S17E